MAFLFSQHVVFNTASLHNTLTILFHKREKFGMPSLQKGSLPIDPWEEDGGCTFYHNASGAGKNKLMSLERNT